jgi:hypothetical protein
MEGVGVPAEDVVRGRCPLSRRDRRCRQLVVMMSCCSGLRRLVQRVERLGVRVCDGRHGVEVVQLVVTLSRGG